MDGAGSSSNHMCPVIDCMDKLDVYGSPVIIQFRKVSFPVEIRGVS